jgi:hypothetical protein
MRFLILVIALIFFNFSPARAQDAGQDGQAAAGSLIEIDALMARAKNEEGGAQEALGNRFESGNGVEQSYVEAANWYQRAAAQGIVKAQAELGNLYAKGLGVPRDYEEAYFWLSLSIDPLNASGNQLLEEVGGYLNSDQKAAVEKRLQAWKPSKKHGAAIANAVERRVATDFCAARDASLSVRLPHRSTRKCKDAFKEMKYSCSQNSACTDCKQSIDMFRDSCGHQEEADPSYECAQNGDCGLVDIDCNSPYAPVSVNREYMSKERKINMWPPNGCPRVSAERQMFRAVCLNNECGVEENKE